MFAQSYYNELVSENPFKKSKVKMLTSNEQDEFSPIQYIDENDFLADYLNTSQQSTSQQQYDEEVNRNKNLMRTLKLFQKAYFNEEIKGENVKVTQWRPKEKVIQLQN